MLAIIKSFVVLSSSIFAGRILSIASLLVFAYFSGPESFSVFGFYISVTNILWIAVFLCYEQAIFVCKNNELNIIIRMSAIISIIFVLVVSLVCILLYLSPSPFASAIGDSRLAFLFIPAGLAARALQRLSSNCIVRAGRFDFVARSNWRQALVQSGALLILLAFGVAPAICLLAADVLGNFSIAIYLALKARDEKLFSNKNKPTWNELKTMALEWKVMPIWRLAMSFASVAALSLPGIFIPIMNTPDLAGAIIFAMRILEIPSNVITGAITPILQQSLSRQERSYANSIRWIAAFSILSVTVFCIILAIIHSTNFLFINTRWAETARSVAPLTPYFIGLTISAPLVGAVIGKSVERISTIYQVIFFTMTATVIYLMQGTISLFQGVELLGLALLIRAAAFAHLYLSQHRLGEP